MLQVHSVQRLDRLEARLGAAVGRHGGEVLAVTHVGQLLGSERQPDIDDAVTLTVCFAEIYARLLRSERQFAAFLPIRIAICAKGGGAFLESISPRECCRLLHRPDLENLAGELEEVLRQVMEDAASRQAQAPTEHLATEDMVNMRAALPQRIDCHGTKIEDLAGTGQHDAAGG